MEWQKEKRLRDQVVFEMSQTEEGGRGYFNKQIYSGMQGKMSTPLL